MVKDGKKQRKLKRKLLAKQQRQLEQEKQPRGQQMSAAGGGPAVVAAAAGGGGGSEREGKRRRKEKAKTDTHSSSDGSSSSAKKAVVPRPSRQMTERYWDSMAKIYDKEIYDSCNDATNRDVVLAILDEYADRTTSCIDFGCGVGKYLPQLSPRFKTVVGIDISQALLDTALAKVVWSGAGRSKQRRLKNVKLQQGNLAHGLSGVPPAGFGCCTNVLLDPSPEAQVRMVASLRKCLLPGAYLMLLVPSLESAIHVGQILPDTLGAALRKSSDHDVFAGQLPREGVLTQYWLREHITRVMEAGGFTVESVQKLEYSWTHEVGESVPPAAATAAQPWDWLAVVKRSSDVDE